MLIVKCADALGQFVGKFGVNQPAGFVPLGQALWMDGLAKVNVDSPWLGEFSELGQRGKRAVHVGGYDGDVQLAWLDGVLENT